MIAAENGFCVRYVNVKPEYEYNKTQRLASQFSDLTCINEVIIILDLDFAVGTPIFIGPTNIEHMQKEHPTEYDKYFALLPKIISVPDFVGINPKDGSIEYIKTFPTNAGNYLKLAVRISGDGLLFARSLYEILDRTVKKRAEKGMLKSLTDQP